jgi:hypothetical protein
MWNAFEEIQGWSIGKVYEVSHVGSNNFKDAAKAWQKSGGHNAVIAGSGGIFFSHFGKFSFYLFSNFSRLGRKNCQRRLLD